MNIVLIRSIGVGLLLSSLISGWSAILSDNPLMIAKLIGCGLITALVGNALILLSKDS